MTYTWSELDEMTARKLAEVCEALGIGIKAGTRKKEIFRNAVLATLREHENDGDARAFLSLLFSTVSEGEIRLSYDDYWLKRVSAGEATYDEARTSILKWAKVAKGRDDLAWLM